MKKCTVCEIEKPFNNFHFRKDSKDGVRNECKVCWNEKKRKYNDENKNKISDNKKKYYVKNKEKILESVKKHKEENREKINEYLRKYFKEYRKKNRHFLNEKMNQYQKKRKKLDPIFKLKYNLRCKLSGHLRKNSIKLHQKTIDILGCDICEFKEYIEKKFTEGMNWENYGLWHLDHIIPISYANNEDEIKKLNHYTNFQPLWALDNILKSNKIIHGS
jgi:hypothetical protein